MGLKLLSRGFVVVLASITAVCILSAGCEKKKEEQAIPRAPVSPQATGQPPQAPEAPGKPSEAPGLASKAPGQPASPHGTMTPKSDKPVVVPDDVKKKWSKVKLAIEDKDAKKTTEYTVKIGGVLEPPGTDLKVSVGEFLPDFRMDETAISSASSEPNNPAVKVEVFEKGKSIFKGWLYVKFPGIHPFEHSRYNITLKEGVKA